MYRLQNLKIRLKKMNIVIVIAIVILCVCVRNKYRIFLAFCFMIKLTPRSAAPPPPANITRRRRRQKLISAPPPNLNTRFAAADQISSAWGSSSRSNRVAISRGATKMGHAGAPPSETGACMSSCKHASAHAGYHDEFDRCWSNSTSVCMGPSCPASQGHSRSSELTRIDQVL